MVILIFGIIFVPKIVSRVKEGRLLDSDRLNQKQPGQLVYLMKDGKRRKAPSFALIDQDSLVVTDTDYLGKVYVAEFFFTSCPTICPIMTGNLVRIQDRFGSDPDFGIASFTIDPEHDTPRVLKEYAESHGVSDLDWHLMTGDRDSIYHLANTGYNIYADETPEVPGGFEHSGLFALVDKQGYLRSRTDAHGNPIIYYRGSVPQAQGKNDVGETEQIGILIEDIQKLVSE